MPREDGRRQTANYDAGFWRALLCAIDRESECTVLRRDDSGPEDTEPTRLDKPVTVELPA